MKASLVTGGLALAALGFALGLWVGGGSLHVGGEDPPTRFAAILRIPEPNDRARALADFFARVNPEEVDGLYEVLNADPEQVDQVAEVLFAAWWARFDPQGALDGRLGTSRGGRHPWTRAVVREWTHRVPEHAVLAVTEMANQQVESHLVAVITLVDGWFEHDDTDPVQLLDAIVPIKATLERGDALNLLLNSMMDARGLDATAQFVDAMPERGAGFRADVFGRFVAQLSIRDPEFAYSWASKHTDETHGKLLLLRLAGRWGYEDGPTAMEWAMTLPPSVVMKRKVVERAYRSFTRANTDQARAWLEARAVTPELESAWALYALGMAKTEPEAALALVAPFEDDRLREKVQKSAGRAWMRSDPIAAGAWLESAGVSSTVRRWVLEPPPKPRQRGKRPVDSRVDSSVESSVDS